MNHLWISWWVGPTLTKRDSSSEYSDTMKLVRAAEPPFMLIAARSKARAASSSVSWSPSDVVLPAAEIWEVVQTTN